MLGRDLPISACEVLVLSWRLALVSRPVSCHRRSSSPGAGPQKSRSGAGLVPWAGTGLVPWAGTGLVPWAGTGLVQEAGLVKGE
jgi:hypothetical protein